MCRRGGLTLKAAHQLGQRVIYNLNGNTRGFVPVDVRDLFLQRERDGPIGMLTLQPEQAWLALAHQLTFTRPMSSVMLANVEV